MGGSFGPTWHGVLVEVLRVRRMELLLVVVALRKILRPHTRTHIQAERCSGRVRRSGVTPMWSLQAPQMRGRVPLSWGVTMVSYAPKPSVPSIPSAAATNALARRGYVGPRDRKCDFHGRTHGRTCGLWTERMTASVMGRM
eukprot:5995102-Pyramimonas_sp.AAC.1